MLLGKVDVWNIYLYKLERGYYSEASEREAAQPTLKPVIVFKRVWSGAESVVPIIYEDNALYFVYTDALTTEQTKELVELRGDGYETLLKEAESALAKHFSRGR